MNILLYLMRDLRHKVEYGKVCAWRLLCASVNYRTRNLFETQRTEIQVSDDDRSDFVR